MKSKQGYGIKTTFQLRSTYNFTCGNIDLPELDGKLFREYLGLDKCVLMQRALSMAQPLSVLTVKGLCLQQIVGRRSILQILVSDLVSYRTRGLQK